MSGKSMQELCESDELKTFFDRRLIKALGHPVREHILAVLNERPASGTEIGEEIGADVSAFYHHIEQLERLGCIERIDTRQRRGAKEHMFQARQTFFFDESGWRDLPATIKADIAASSLQHLFDDVVRGLESGAINVHDKRHVSWTPAEFDERGWAEARALLTQTLTILAEIQRRSGVRLAEGDAVPVYASMAMLAFETGKGSEG